MDDNRSPFTDVDLTIEDYRPFSMLSLVSLLLSLFCGMLVMVNPPMAPGAVMAAGFAIFVLAWLFPRRRKINGYKMAGCALFISLFAISSSLAYQQHRRKHLEQTAVAFSENWVDLARQGRIHELYQLSLHYNNRATPETDLVQKYGTLTSPGPELELYLKQEPEVSIRQDAEEGRLQTVLTKYEKLGILKERVIVGFKYTRPNGDVREFGLYLVRMDYPTPPGPQWYVEGLVNYNPKIARQLTDQQRGTESMPEDM